MTTAIPQRWAGVPNRGGTEAGTHPVPGDAGHGGILQNDGNPTCLAVGFLDA